jgi:hypothetical protein
MAFQLETVHNSGVIANYWRLAIANVDCSISAPVVRMQMDLYVNIDARFGGKQPLEHRFILADLALIDVTYSYDFRACIYNYLKSTPEWSNSIDVLDEPNIPVVYPVNLSVDFDTAKNFNTTGFDNLNLPLVFSISKQTDHGDITGTNGNFTYTPNIGFYGSDYAEFIADNGDFQSSVSPINITVKDSAFRPSVAVITVTTQNNTAAEVTLLGTDPNSLPLTYHIVTEPVNGILSVFNNIYTYTPNADFVGSDSFTYNVSNGTLSSLNGSVEIFIQGA